MRDISFALLLLTSACARGAAEVSAAPEADERVPVLVELFTSEGCSSCPRADALLALLAREQPLPGIEVLALAEHVDYWDGLGWKDAFSSAQLTARQQAYVRRRGRPAVYTPAAVVDGSEDVVGSDARALEERIRRAAAQPKARVGLTAALSPDVLALRVQAGSLPTGLAAVLIAVVEDGLERDVSRGENAGRHLRHHAVVRKLVRAGDTGGEAWSGEVVVPLDPAWNRARLRAVAFAEERSTGRVIAAGSATMPQGASTAPAAR